VRLVETGIGNGTLLIPMAVWATIRNVRIFNQLFHNPRSGLEHQYDQPIEAMPELQSVDHQEHPVDQASSQMFVSRYFGGSLRPIVWFGPKEPENYLWSLLEHLWPKLRTMFASCTFSLQQRTLEDRPFDLLFAPSAVYSRFTKLPPEHIIEPSSKKIGSDQEADDWCVYWAKAMFSDRLGLPSAEDELDVWNELSEDPSSIRKLSLVHELRSRAYQSPTAGVGAIDLVESLARKPETALLLKNEVFTDAIGAALRSSSVDDSISTLRLIDDRIGRDAFRGIAGHFEGQLKAASQKLTVDSPDAAVIIAGTRLNDHVMGDRSAFVSGVFSGLVDVARSSPSRLAVLKDYPEVASAIFRQVPTFTADFLQIGGEQASHTVAVWLLANSDFESREVARRSILQSLDTFKDEQLIYALIRDVPEYALMETLDQLFARSKGFQSSMLRDIITAHISPAYPNIVRKWASHVTRWTDGLSSIVALTFPQNRTGVESLLNFSDFDGRQKAETLSALLREQFSGGSSYWLKELASNDGRIIELLVSNCLDGSKAIETALSKLLIEVSSLPIAQFTEERAIGQDHGGASVGFENPDD
jgi:hypothetical protein